MGKYLAYFMFVLSLGASIGYFLAKDYKRGFYWFFAACITLTVTQ